jgi:hypothetical protein
MPFCSGCARWGRKSVLLPELAGFTNLCLPATKCGQTENCLSCLQLLLLRLLRLLRILPRSATAADSFCRSVRIRTQTRFCPTRHASSSTRSPDDLSCHSTSNPGLSRHDSPYRMPSLSVASTGHRLITSSMPAGSLSLCVQHLAVGVRTRSCCTNVVLLYKEHRL